MKKILSAAVALVMALSCFGFLAFAEETPEPFTLDTVEIIDDQKTVYAQFSIPFMNDWNGESANYFAAVRILDNMTDANLIWIGEPFAEGSTPVQWGGGCDYPLGAGGDYSLLSCTIGANLSCTTIHDIFKLVRPGGKFEGCVVAFCIEEAGTDVQYGNGIIDNFYDYTTGTYFHLCDADHPEFARLKATHPGKNENDPDRVYMQLEDIWLEEDLEKEAEASAKASEKANTTTADVTTATETTAAETTAPVTGDDGGNSNLIIYIIAGAVLLIAIVVVVIIVVKKKH